MDHVLADPAAVYAAVRRAEDSVQTMRARFSATVHQGDNVRQADGVLVVKKPDRFRMRLLSPFGLTVFDYTSWDGHARMELPLEGKRLSDSEITAESAFTPGDLRQAFLRAGAAFPGRCTPRAAAAETIVECRDAEGTLLRVLHIEQRTQTITEEVSFASGVPHLTMQYDDYRAVGAALLPFAIHLSYPERQVTLAISVRNYEVNPALADELFSCAPPLPPVVRPG